MHHQSPFGYLEGPVIVSACLMGVLCRYDGKTKTCPSILELPGIIPVSLCPERLGGMPTPRPSARFEGGDGRLVLADKAVVRNSAGEDVTGSFLSGAEYCCKAARALGIEYAILKEGSPSCGTHRVWIDGELRPGIGVAAAMMESVGITLLNEDGLKI